MRLTTKEHQGNQFIVLKIAVTILVIRIFLLTD